MEMEKEINIEAENRYQLSTHNHINYQWVCTTPSLGHSYAFIADEGEEGEVIVPGLITLCNFAPKH